MRLHWSSVFANAHRILYNNIWTSYIRQNNVRSEAGRRGSVSACDSGCHHADWNFTTISRPKDDTLHKMKRDMLLHNVGTHQVEDHLDVCSDDARRCAKQNELRTLELPISKRDMQVADSVSTAGPRADFMTFSTSSCSNKVCWNTCARYASRAHYVTSVWEHCARSGDTRSSLSLLTVSAVAIHRSVTQRDDGAAFVEALQRRLASCFADHLKHISPYSTFRERLMTRCTRNDFPRDTRLHGHPCHLTLVFIEFIEPVVSELTWRSQTVSRQSCVQAHSWPGLIIVFDIANVRTFIHVLFDAGLI